MPSDTWIQARPAGYCGVGSAHEALQMKTAHGRERGQAVVEFAIAFPVFIMLVMGLMNASWLFFQQQSVTDAARAGAREAALLSPLFENGTATGCSSTYGEPSSSQATPALPIESAVSRGSSLVPVNASALCATSATSATMTSSVSDSSKATVTVTASPTLQSPTTVTVTVTYVARPLVPFWPVTSDTLTSSSTETIDGNA